MSITLRPYQQEAVDAVWNHLRTRDDNPCVVLPTGCHAKGHPIFMHDGSVKKVEDIEVGDKLLGDDLMPRTVLSLVRGTGEMIKVIPKHTIPPFVVNYDHIMPVYDRESEEFGRVKYKNIKIGDIHKYKERHSLFRMINGFCGAGVVWTPFTTEAAGNGKYYGFTLDGNNLYLDAFGVIHHNCGKSIVLGEIASQAVKKWNGRVLVLAHVKELLEQNSEKIRSLCPGVKVGIYSAGLKSRDTKDQIIVAGIQSVYKRACELGKFDLIIVDEVHLIPPDGEGRYREFLQDAKVVNPNVRLIGFTATPFRLRGGLICKPENMMNHICYEAGLKEMILKGYLSPIIPKQSCNISSVDFDSLHIKAGEFVAEEVEILMNNERLVANACHEIVELTRERKAVLIFGCSIAHCNKIKKYIEEYSGEECAMVTGDTPAYERAEVLDRIKGKTIQADLFGGVKKPLKYLCNVSVLTTGFDAPNIDCIAMLRPTASPGLLVQIVGRGLRLSPATGKQNCLFLDYGDNVLRHGTLDAIRVDEHENSNSKKREPPAKACPKCQALIETARTACPYCGYVFPPKELKHDFTASEDGLLTGQVVIHEEKVSRVNYMKWVKQNDASKPPTLCIEYEIGFNNYFREWLCPEHTGYARQKFEKWWEEHRQVKTDPIPDTVDEAIELANMGSLYYPVKISIRHIAGEKFDRICNYEYGEPDIIEVATEEDEAILLGESPDTIPVDALPF